MWAFKKKHLDCDRLLFQKSRLRSLKKIVEMCSNSMREQINRANRDEELLPSSIQNKNFRFTEILPKTQCKYLLKL